MTFGRKFILGQKSDFFHQKYNACFSEKCFFERKKDQTPFLPQDNCGACFCLILIHRKALETLCLVTGLAQWAGTRIRPRSRIRRVPGSIPGTTESYFLSYFWGIFEYFGVCLGHIFGDFSDIFGHFLIFFGDVWECCGDLWGAFGIGLGEF